MFTLVVASTNPVKGQAAINGFQRLFPGSELNVVTAAVASNVAHQPMSDEKTLRGALNRSAHAQAAHPDADYWIGIEGGIQPIGQEMMAFAWIVVRSKIKRSTRTLRRLSFLRKVDWCSPLRGKDSPRRESFQQDAREYHV